MNTNAVTADISTAKPLRPTDLPPVTAAPMTLAGGFVSADTYTDVMLDLETLGVAPGYAIVSIGAVAFNPLTRKLGPMFYGVATRASCLELGLKLDADTLAWWAKQSPEARQEYNIAEAGDPPAQSLLELLVNFDTYVEDLAINDRKPAVWGLGADFDGPILAAAFRAAGRKEPWRKNRCLRMLKDLYPEVQVERTGTHHHALHDAVSQAHWAIRLLDRHEASRRAHDAVQAVKAAFAGA